MAWQLTTPVTSGDLDSSDYDLIKLTRFVHDSTSNRIMINWVYGYLDEEGEMVNGIQPRGSESHAIIDGDDYLTLVSTHEPLEGEKTYVAIKRGLYEWLLAEGKIGPGIVI